MEWTMVSTNVSALDIYYPNFEQTYSRLALDITWARQSSYYIWKIALGSVLLVIMAIAVFAFQVHEPDRVGSTLTIFLALISFLFVAGTSLPKVPPFSPSLPPSLTFPRCFTQHFFRLCFVLSVFLLCRSRTRPAWTTS